MGVFEVVWSSLYVLKNVIVIQGVGGSSPLTRPNFPNKIKYLL
jgi:hypothetical protein